MAKLKAKINGQWVEIGSDGSGSTIPQTTSLLKGDGEGGVSAATAGTDYQAPIGNGDITVSMLDDGVYTEIAERLNVHEGLFDNINKPFTFTGKKAAWYGDSIVAGYYGTGLVTENSFAKLFTVAAGGTYSGHGVGGATICGEYSSSVIAYHLSNGAEADADIVFVAGGTNDHTLKKPLGAYTDTGTHLTFYGALKEICENLQTHNSNAEIIFITPINKLNAVADEVAPLDAYRKAIYEVATSYGYSVIDGSKVGFWNAGATANTWGRAMMTDGIHPSLAGHRLYANYLRGMLL